MAYQGVLTNSVARRDIGFTRGMTFRWGVEWTRSADGGRTWQPVDLTAYDIRVQLLAMDETVWLEKACDGTSVTGVAIASIGPADTGGDEWRARRSGVWRILARQPDGEALSTKWLPPDGSGGSVLQTYPDVESGEATVIGWGYWRAG